MLVSLLSLLASSSSSAPAVSLDDSLSSDEEEEENRETQYCPSRVSPLSMGSPKDFL